MIKVSVIIPAFRSAGTICRAVDSVLAQTRPAHEMIVVDDGSPDDQANVVRSTYGDRVKLIRQPNRGAAGARNTGIERATGDCIAFLDADDYWEPQKLERQLEVLENYPEVGLVAAECYLEPPRQPRYRASQIAYPPKAYNRPLRVSGPAAFAISIHISTITVVLRSEALGRERFCTDLPTAEDCDLWVRIIDRHPVYLLHDPLATAVLEPQSLSRANVDRDCQSMLKMVEQNRGLLGAKATRLWRSHTLYRWAANDPNPSSALPRLAKSFWLWPWPYFRVHGMRRLGRLKRLLVLMANSARIRAH